MYCYYCCSYCCNYGSMFMNLEFMIYSDDASIFFLAVLFQIYLCPDFHDNLLNFPISRTHGSLPGLLMPTTPLTHLSDINVRHYSLILEDCTTCHRATTINSKWPFKGLKFDFYQGITFQKKEPCYLLLSILILWIRQC